MTKEDFLQKIEDILEVDPDSLTGDELLQSLEGWNSLAMMSFQAMADQDADVRISVVQLKQSKTLNDLYALLT